MQRDNFPKKIKTIIEKRAAYICSNPKCNRLCIGPAKSVSNKTNYFGKVAHITAASPNGPRYDKSIIKEERSSAENAIFLCSNCAEMIDKNNGIDYPKELLYEWKKKHEEFISEQQNSNQTQNVKSKEIDLSGFFTKSELKVMALYKDIPVYKDYIKRLIELATKYGEYFKKSELKDMVLRMNYPVFKELIENELELRSKYGKKTRRARKKSKSKQK